MADFVLQMSNAVFCLLKCRRLTALQSFLLSPFLVLVPSRLSSPPSVDLCQHFYFSSGFFTKDTNASVSRAF